MSLFKTLRQKIFGKKNLANIVAPLNKIKQELEDLISSHADENNAHAATIAEANAKIADNELTIKTAQKVRDNVGNLLA